MPQTHCRFSSIPLIKMQFLADHYPEVSLRDYMGQAFADLFAERPDTFYRELTLDQILFLRNATNMTANQQQMMAEIDFMSKTGIKKEDSDEDLLKSGRQDTEQGESDELMDSATAAHAAKLKADQEREMQEREEEFAILSSQKKEESLVTTMHEPYDILQQGSLFAGSKYQQEVKINDMKFNPEIERYCLPV